MKIANVSPHEEYWQCGDGCCDLERLTTTIEFDDQVFEYTSDYTGDVEKHIFQFLKDAGIIDLRIKQATSEIE